MVPVALPPAEEVAQVAASPEGNARYRRARAVGDAGAIAVEVGVLVATVGVGVSVVGLMAQEGSPVGAALVVGGCGVALAGDVALFAGGLSAARRAGAPVDVGVVGVAMTAGALLLAPFEPGPALLLGAGGAALGGVQLAHRSSRRARARVGDRADAPGRRDRAGLLTVRPDARTRTRPVGRPHPWWARRSSSPSCRARTPAS